MWLTLRSYIFSLRVISVEEKWILLPRPILSLPRYVLSDLRIWHRVLRSTIIATDEFSKIESILFHSPINGLLTTYLPSRLVYLPPKDSKASF